MEFPLYHAFNAQNFEVTPTHFENVCPLFSFIFRLENLGGMIIKFTEEQATKAQREVHVSSTLSLTSSLHG